MDVWFLAGFVKGGDLLRNVRLKARQDGLFDKRSKALFF